MPHARKSDSHLNPDQHSRFSKTVTDDALASTSNTLESNKAKIGLHPEFIDEMDLQKLSKSVPDGTAGDIKKVHQHNTELLLHKLGQRLAFERASVRLYEALIIKCLANRKEIKTVISLDQLRQFRDEEVEHSLLLKTAIETLGFDPDEWIPDTDSTLLASLQIPKVFTKKNTTVLQCLESVLIFATNDNSEWHTLHELFTNMGLKDLADEFNQALEEDSRQLEALSRWIYQLSHA
ncbi:MULTISPECIES: ferritin-like domain-containing protein [unclassified Methylophaga]|jgi:bacterioferritin (cytochrome b1)|uniref:ferritin-like domain-containing protein n=1 Tax=unclassified Methylophaga TaxID=2629249 RepID=UPI000C9892A0|nr:MULTISPECIES: ferritin-like domain-containing protein [unclassified Methylophaga]MAK66549.1 hypothetical protein [Methylophaga sp.]MAY17242.1 hypothetical protein [Methylophaga sp.]HAO24189.1 hypothetical protein [Methylophaga sp.]HCD04954.1 hypothetical protein [Methylophaga sp.]|tara:strand:- start:14255 stop:14962 length:708 start_codon:yes stop_codon:yes gene_type:complete